LTTRPSGYVTVPGNHDVYLPDVIREQRFERHFGDMLHSDLPESCVDGRGRWAVLRRARRGDRGQQRPTEPRTLAFERSDSAPPAHGARSPVRRCTPPEALRLHRDPLRATARGCDPDTASHRLENADAFLDACRGLRRGAIVHGHIHKRFHLALPGLNAPIFGAGSTTCDTREGLWLFDVDDSRTVATPGSFRESAYVLEHEARVEF